MTNSLFGTMNILAVAIFATFGYFASVDAHSVVPYNLVSHSPPWYSPDYSTYNSLELISSFPQGFSHPCERKCVTGQSMTCYYEFVVHYYEVASRICAIHNNSTSKGCIRADGVPTGVMVVNRQLQGPEIMICEHDTVVVDVLNNLREGITIHWHGLFMKRTPDMDGAPYTTQYPINPGENFRYKFCVEQHGTFWWHSHIGFQRAFGIAGALISRQPDEQNTYADQYDFDLNEHVVVLSDWYYNFTSTTPRNILINGKGHNNDTQFYKRSDKKSLNYERFIVKQGYRYRFRFIYNGNANCPLEVSIDDHDMQIISSDGLDIEPVTVKKFNILSAERFDAVLYASQKVGSYYMRVKGLGFCAASQIHQAAIIQYKGSYEFGGIPKPKLTYDYTVTGAELNPIDVGPSNDPNKITIYDLNSITYTDWESNTKFKTYYSNLGLYNAGGQFGFQMDNIFFEMPALSLLQARYLDIEPFFCNKTSLKASGKDCKTEFCKCWNIIQVPAYEHIEFVISSDTARGHAFHSHGFDYRVVGMGVLGQTDILNIEEIDKATPLKRRRDRSPAIKDTTQVPGYGYIIIDFFTGNPGFWMFHCHLSVHSEAGMMSILKVGDNHQMVPTAKSNCHAYNNNNVCTAPIKKDY